MRAAVYARFSTERQRESSITDQFRLCQAAAEGRGWAVAVRHADEGVSGSTPVASRSGGAALLADVLAGRVEVVVLEGLDRLSRDLVEQETIVRRLEHRGVRIVGVSDGYDSQSAARKLHRGMRGLINEVYLDDLRAKTHRGLEGQVVRGMARAREILRELLGRIAITTDDAGTWADMETTPAAQVAAGASLDVVAGARFVFRRRFRIC